MRTVIVDSWALVAWIRNEQPAASEVRRLLEQAETGAVYLLLSTINAGEVFYITAKRHSRAQAMHFRQQLPALPVTLVTPDENAIWAAAELKSRYNLSYADAFAAALALSRNADLLTGDQEFQAVEGLRIAWLARA